MGIVGPIHRLVFASGFSATRFTDPIFWAICSLVVFVEAWRVNPGCSTWASASGYSEE